MLTDRPRLPGVWAEVVTGVAWLARSTVRIRWHGASETHRFKVGTATWKCDLSSYECSSVTNSKIEAPFNSCQI